jgi:peptidoglycan/LPS O-acetylase OafA/YrhL
MAADLLSRPAEKTKPQHFRLGYRPALDGLRGIAVLMVMIFHFHPGFGSGGFLGVDVFFVLSGFLITSLLLDEWHRTQGISLRRFYVRRALRLLPALLLMLAVTVPFVGIIWGAVTIGYVANWFLAFGWLPISPLSHVWSLSVEEQFYLIWPLTLGTLLRVGLPRRGVLGVTTLLAVGSALLKVALWSNTGSWLRLYHGSDTRADALLIGCALAMAVTWRFVPSHRSFGWGVQAAAIAAAGLLVWLGCTANIGDAFLYRDGGLTLVALAAGALVLQAVSFPIPVLRAALEWPLLVGVGRISYGLYLWHYPISWIPVPGDVNPIVVLVARFVASFAVAGACFYWIERPLLQRKRAWHS